ncbi:hypothetical protein [Enterobacter cloacae]|uniref:hypothetical protein n=1 Tax=Enterobacter cloacae TaxID=550 RepID=UPI002FF8AA99
MKKINKIIVFLMLGAIPPVVYNSYSHKNIADQVLKCRAYIILDRYNSDNENIYTSYALMVKKTGNNKAESTFSGTILSKKDSGITSQNIFATNYYSYQVNGNRLDISTSKVITRPGNTVSEDMLSDYVSSSLRDDFHYRYYMYLIDNSVPAFGEATFPRVICGKDILPP